MTLCGFALPPGAAISKDVTHEIEFKLTFFKSFPLEIVGPLAGVVHLAGIPPLGVGEQIWVRLGDLGAQVVTGQEVKVL